MTDRINSILVTLDQDIRDDDIEPILTALRMVKHVLDVSPNVADYQDHIAKTRAAAELEQRLLAAFNEWRR